MNLFFLFYQHAEEAAHGADSGSDPFALITPDPGLFIWTTIVFAILWLLLAKFAFKPIAKGLRSREESISDALKEAERARAEIAELKNENEDLLKEAREERSKILREANELKAKIVSEAKEEAKKEATKVIEDAQHEINVQKSRAFKEAKEDIGKIAVEIAEKLMKKDLESTANQEELIASLVKDVKFNQN